MKVISLFAGIGGFDTGFQRAGFDIAAHVEKDANCLKLLKDKWPDAVAVDDVCKAGASNLPPCDVVTFGFPCQDLSVAGKRAGLKGKRSGLFYEATRVIRELQPAWALFENVPGLLSSGGGADFAAVLAEMGECGYHGAWRVLDAQWFGVAQRRRRVFGLFTRLDSGAERCAEILSIPESLRGHPAPCREAWEGTTRSVAHCLGSGGNMRHREDQDTLIPAVAQPIRNNVYNNSDPMMEARGLIPTGMQVRRLTPTECERLQGFPDGHTAGFSDSTRYKMLGNAVCVNVAEWIARRLEKRCLS
jgi:DNA (cytosine-5)-methyltransferase 1